MRTKRRAGRDANSRESHNYEWLDFYGKMEIKLHVARTRLLYHRQSTKKQEYLHEK